MKPRWIIRIVVGLVLVAALGLGLMDYRAKTAAQETHAAWREVDLYGDATDVPDFEAKLKGSPEIKQTTRPQSPVIETDYTWRGIIRNYRVQLVSIEEKGQVIEVSDLFNE